MKPLWIIASLWLIIISPCKAQKADSLTDLPKTNRYFRYNFENDLFNHTDRYYTQGLNPQLIAPFVKRSLLAKVLIRGGSQAQNYYGLSVEQDCFTPRNIEFDTLNRSERPYSGLIFLTHFLISIDPIKKQRLTTSLDLGLIGSCAACAAEQKSIHKLIENVQPQGWQNQISNDLVLNYSAMFEKGLYLNPHLELIGFASARLGTLYDDITGGINFRFGLMNSYFKNLGIIKNATKNKIQIYFDASARAKFVGYNATLQGGFFESSIYTIKAERITRGVYTINGGMVLAYKRISLEYSRYFLTKEFLEGIDHGWGRCTILFCF